MGCDGIWEKKSNEEAVIWVYDKIKEYQSKGKEVDIKQIVADLLHDNLAQDVTSSGKYKIWIKHSTYLFLTFCLTFQVVSAATT